MRRFSVVRNRPVIEILGDVCNPDIFLSYNCMLIISLASHFPVKLVIMQYIYGHFFLTSGPFVYLEVNWTILSCFEVKLSIQIDVSIKHGLKALAETLHLQRALALKNSMSEWDSVSSIKNGDSRRGTSSASSRTRSYSCGTWMDMGNKKNGGMES